jgi:tetratricopeptide (TPR) repeat protein
MQEVLAWADQQGQDQILVELLLLLTHYMSGRLLFSMRLYYARKAVEAASRLDRKEDAALLHIDALGWQLIDVGHLEEAIREILAGLHIAESLDASSTDAIGLIALANAFLARAFLGRGDLAEASMLINKVVSGEYKPVIQDRVITTAGHIAYKKNNYTEAMELYKSLSQIGKQYNDDGRYVHLGNVYLAMGEVKRAEDYFNEAIMIHSFNHDEVMRAKYGIARVALARGERDKARQVALETLEDLLHTVGSHKLSNEIENFLKSLEDTQECSDQV